MTKRPSARGRVPSLAAALLASLAAASAQERPASNAEPKPAPGAAPKVELRDDAEASVLTVLADGKELLGYRYGHDEPIPDLCPVRSPSGKLLTFDRGEPYPHHRSIWIADGVALPDGRRIDFYHCEKNHVDPKDPKSAYRHFIRHESFGSRTAKGDEATFTCKLRWIVDGEKPVVVEHRTVRVRALGDGEALVDLTWRLEPASKQPVTIQSDKVHYAWPFVRMHPQFSGEKKGTIRDDKGNTTQKATDGKAALWIDVSNEVDGVVEGLAVFPFPDGPPRKWLTREYGTFGPRREDEKSGVPIELGPRDALDGRAAVLIHRGDAEAGRVAQRYAAWVKGEL